MERVFILNEPNLVVAPGVKVIKATSAQRLLTSLELVKSIVDLKKEAQTQAETEFFKRKEEGYKEGLAAGQAEYSLKIMDAVMASVEYLENLESGLVKLINDAVRKIIGEIPSDEVIVRIVKKALNSARSARRVLIRVSPQDEEAVRAALEGNSGSESFLDIRADGRLSQGDCVLESELGLIEASLETQLKNLALAMESRIKNA
ncbi:MAG: HrpE/YscL family type III secretion apparatus protein [Deltaproteobacteria bacterium]|jgi:type III secretion protein L|nr:HrpE/YscL family type III secretion apparatus protein [Deltaproteobacteria bacterium]